MQPRKLIDDYKQKLKIFGITLDEFEKSRIQTIS